MFSDWMPRVEKAALVAPGYRHVKIPREYWKVS